MPVFHTKMIQSILDPVAQQVSQLVILHEEAQSGKIVSDLVQPVAAVKGAVDNLVVVGRQTLEQTKDEIMKVDMPPTFVMIETATTLLLEAAKALSGEDQKPEGKKMLLDGSRGILQGVSQLLLVFDQAEVRKIIKNCENIIEYLKVAEQVQIMDELVMFTRNLTPGMTNMTKQVDARQEDLTNPSHAAILGEESEQVKKALPLLLSAMKAFVTLTKTKSKGADDAQENRNYIVGAMTASIKELIRVLQLTSPSEEKGAMASTAGGDQTSFGKFLPGSIAAKVHYAKELLQESGKDPETDKAGIAAVAACTSEARRIAKGFSAQRRAAVLAMCDEIDKMAAELAELQARGEGGSMRAQAIALALGQELDKLEATMKTGIAHQVMSDFKDTLGPLNQLTESAKASLDTPGREAKFETSVDTFKAHSSQMARTAANLAKSGGITDKKVADDLITSSSKVKVLAPQVVHAATMLFHNPDNEAAQEHYKLIKEDYEKEVLKLTKLVDGAVDSVDFIAASEKQLKEDMEEAKAIIKAGDNPQKAFAHVASAARTASRVVTITQAEVDNTDDPEFKTKLTAATAEIKQGIAPVVTTAKEAIQHNGSEIAQATFSRSGEKLVAKVHEVHSILDAHYYPPPPPTPPPPPPEEVPPPPPPEPTPERPPLPAEEVEIDEMDLAAPPPSNPIGFAAHQLHQEAKQWEEKDNTMVAAAKKMAKLMMQMAKYTSGEDGELKSKKDFIMTARQIAKESDEVVKMAMMVAESCTDRRMKRALLQVVEKIPTIATQLKIIAAVKATRQGGDDREADKEASEMLTDNAQNLMKAVSEVLYATEAASIRVSPDSKAAKAGLRFVKKGALQGRMP